MNRQLVSWGVALAISAVFPTCSLAQIAGDHPANSPRTEAPDLIALERLPGHTEALESAAVAPGPPAPGIAGKPGASPAFGPNDAAVKVYVFSDFQCPVCSRTVEPIKHLVRTHDDVQVIFKNNALSSHSRAAAAAAAALAAARQGKFWAYHDLLFANQRALGESDLVGYARELRLDLERFRRDMSDPGLVAQVDYETGLAQELGLRGTPSFVVNGDSFTGWGSYASLEGRVARELVRARELAREGVDAANLAERATLAAGESGQEFARLMWGLLP